MDSKAVIIKSMKKTSTFLHILLLFYTLFRGNVRVNSLHVFALFIVFSADKKRDAANNDNKAENSDCDSYRGAAVNKNNEARKSNQQSKKYYDGD